MMCVECHEKMYTIMKKMKLQLILLFLPILCFGQSKKEQIEAMKSTIDSLKNSQEIMRSNSTKEIGLLESKVNEMSSELSAINSNVANLQLLNRILTLENDSLKVDIEKLSNVNALHLDNLMKMELMNESGRLNFRLYQDGEGLYGQKSCEIFLNVGTELHHILSAVGHPEVLENFGSWDVPVDAVEAIRISYSGDRIDLYTKKLQVDNLKYIVIMVCYAYDGGDGNCQFVELKRIKY